MRPFLALALGPIGQTAAIMVRELLLLNNTGFRIIIIPSINSGHEIRSQVCDYGRKIQRRGCPARQAQQRNFAPPPRQVRENESF